MPVYTTFISNYLCWLYAILHLTAENI